MPVGGIVVRVGMKPLWLATTRKRLWRVRAPRTSGRVPGKQSLSAYQQIEAQLDYGPGSEIGVGWKIGVTWFRKRGFKTAVTELGYLLTKLSFWLSLSGRGQLRQNFQLVHINGPVQNFGPPARNFGPLRAESAWREWRKMLGGQSRTCRKLSGIKRFFRLKRIRFPLLFLYWLY